jgi:hypothetical protein
MRQSSTVSLLPWAATIAAAIWAARARLA